MIVIANVLPKLQTVKGLVRPLSKKPRFRTPFIVNMLKSPKHLWNLHESNLIIFSITLKETDFKTSVLVICEILGVFVTTLTADGKYPFWNCEKSWLPIQSQFPKKAKLFVNSMFRFWNFNEISDQSLTVIVLKGHKHM